MYLIHYNIPSPMEDEDRFFSKASSTLWKLRAYIYAPEFWIVLQCSEMNPDKSLRIKQMAKSWSSSSLIAYENKDELKTYRGQMRTKKWKLVQQSKFNRKQKQTSYNYPTKKQFLFHISHKKIDNSFQVSPAKHNWSSN